MWEPQPLEILRASTACTGITLLTILSVSKEGYNSNRMVRARKLHSLFWHARKRDLQLCEVQASTLVSRTPDDGQGPKTQ
jgi:hypothetical protein